MKRRVGRKHETCVVSPTQNLLSGQSTGLQTAENTSLRTKSHNKLGFSNVFQSQALTLNHTLDHDRPKSGIRTHAHLKNKTSVFSSVVTSNEVAKYASATFVQGGPEATDLVAQVNDKLQIAKVPVRLTSLQKKRLLQSTSRSLYGSRQL